MVFAREIYLDGQTICIYNKTWRDVFEILDEQNGEVGYSDAYLYRKVVPDQAWKAASENAEMPLIEIEKKDLVCSEMLKHIKDTS